MLILGVFNPLVMTSMMRSLLLPADDYGHLFDEMRNQFNYRHEFAYTQVQDTMLDPKESAILQNLGLNLLHS